MWVYIYIYTHTHTYVFEQQLFVNSCFVKKNKQGRMY